MSIKEMLEGAAAGAPVGAGAGYGELVTTFAAVAVVAHRLAAILKDVKPEVVAGAKAWRERQEAELEADLAYSQLATAVEQINATQLDILEALARIAPNESS